MRMLSYLYVSICLQSWLLTSIIKLPFLMPREARRMASGCTAGPTDPCAQGAAVKNGVLPRWLRVVFRVSLVDSVEWCVESRGFILIWKLCWKNTKGSSFATLNRCWFYMSSVQNSRLVCSSGIILTKFEKRLIGDNHNPWGSIPPIIPTSILDLTNQPLHTI
jgi:hypothetical protein